MQNTLYYGDNLEILRKHVPDESVDLIYLDPPFNSSRTYNLLFKQHKGDTSPAQIMAFEDTWQWSKLLYDEFMGDARNTKLFDLVESFYRILGGSEMMAYVVMMAPRLLDLHRTLKPTGSLYLHCDPSACHYLKMVLDVVFQPEMFVNQAIWKRTSAHSDAKQGARHLGRTHDVILVFKKTRDVRWNTQYLPHDPSYMKTHYPYTEPETGRRFGLWDITGPGGAAKGNPIYEVYGIVKYWRYSEENMQRKIAEGRIVQPSPSAIPREKRYLDESFGVPLSDVWTDIPPINSQAKERRGFPTQKPLALLERIIAASSNDGDVVMDPFAGCGTAVVAAERMNRKWIGIDVTYLAIAEVIYRLTTENVAGREAQYNVVGSPTDSYSARKFFEETKPQNHKPFEMWAVSLVKGEPIEKKGGDRGIDGRIRFYDPGGKSRYAMIQVKGGHVGPAQIRDFAHVIEREKALFGLFITLNDETRQMREAAEEMGIVEGFGSRRIPRMQIRTIKELLEEKKPFDLPLSWSPAKHAGVGEAQPKHPALEFDPFSDE